MCLVAKPFCPSGQLICPVTMVTCARAALVLAAVASGLIPSTRRSRPTVSRASAVEENTEKALAPAPKCPLNNEGQLLAARDAVLRATEAGITRQRVRTLLPRGVDRECEGKDAACVQSTSYVPSPRSRAMRPG